MASPPPSTIPPQIIKKTQSLISPSHQNAPFHPQSNNIFNPSSPSPSIPFNYHSNPISGSCNLATNPFGFDHPYEQTLKSNHQFQYCTSSGGGGHGYSPKMGVEFGSGLVSSNGFEGNNQGKLMNNYGDGNFGENYDKWVISHSNSSSNNNGMMMLNVEEQKKYCYYYWWGFDSDHWL